MAGTKKSAARLYLLGVENIKNGFGNRKREAYCQSKRKVHHNKFNQRGEKGNTHNPKV